MDSHSSNNDLIASHEAGEEIQTRVSLAAMMTDGTVNSLGVLKDTLTTAMNIDEPGIYGRTPLIIACLRGQEDVARFLLEKGANPNSSCRVDGNTSLHFVCTRPKRSVYSYMFPRRHRGYENDQVDSRISIIQLLLNHGATLEQNLNGLIPPCVAAFFGQKELVEFFMSHNCTTHLAVADKVRIWEYLAVSQSIFISDSSRNASSSLSNAISLRQECPTALHQETTKATLEECFSCTECHTVESVKMISNDENALKIQGFLLGERLLNENLKGEYFFTCLLDYANSVLFDSKGITDAHVGYEIFMYALILESQGRLKLGSVLNLIAQQINFHRLEIHALSESSKVIISCLKVCKEVETNWLREKSCQLIEDLGNILFNLAFYNSVPDLVESVLESVQDMVRLIRITSLCVESNCPSENIGAITHDIVSLLAEAFVDNMYSGIGRHALYRVKRVICRLLCCDDASYQDKDGDTMLHILMSVIFLSRDSEYVIDLSRVIVRHGCPVDAINNEEMTAYEIISADDCFDPEDVGDKELVLLLNPSTTVLRLEEMASRVIFSSKIPYREILPVKLCEMIEGESFEPDMEALNSPTSNDSEPKSE